MTRLYIQPSFLNSCEEHGLWSGGNDQYRGDRSVDLATFDKNGRARVEAFSDAAIESLKKKTSVPLKQRILPQASRVDKLRSEAIELELAFKAGEFSAEEYTLLRSVAFRKLHRAEELLKKATTPIQKEEETDEDSAQVQAEYTPSSDFSPQPNDGYTSEKYEEIGVRFIDELSDSNSLKNILKKACIITRKVIHYKHKISSYLNELKEV